MKLLLLAAVAGIVCSQEESPLLQEFRAGNIQFSADIYKEFQKTNSKNFLICPLSVQVVLALLQSGSGGNTAQQLANGLRVPSSAKKLHDTFKEVSSSLHGNDHYKLSSANKIYVKNGFTINDDYKKTAVDVFDAEIQTVDFKNQDQAVNEINRWIESKTDNQIKDMLKPRSLSENSVAVLVNAMYFHGEWKKKFPHEATRLEPFHLNSKESIDVQMMSLKYRFKYYESLELKAQFLEFPYKGFDVTMTIVLPNDVEGLSALENNIVDVLAEPKYQISAVVLKMPKFSIGTDIKFKTILNVLGINDVFGSSADFTGIGSGPDPLLVNEVLQKTFIDVQEDGTVAAAATIVGLLGATGPSREQYKTFTADHPFIFYLKSQAGIMFVGRYVGVQ